MPQNNAIKTSPTIPIGILNCQREYIFPRLPPIIIPFSNNAVCFAVFVRAMSLGITPSLARKAKIPVATVRPDAKHKKTKKIYFSHISVATFPVIINNDCFIYIHLVLTHFHLNWGWIFRLLFAEYVVVKNKYT